MSLSENDRTNTFNTASYRSEHYQRLGKIVDRGSQDGMTPNEAVKRVIREAVQLGNPFIVAERPYVVLGNDGFDGSWFPTGSFETAEEAREHALRRADEEQLYSDGSEISTTFHPFTRDGLHIGYTQEESK